METMERPALLTKQVDPQAAKRFGTDWKAPEIVSFGKDIFVSWKRASRAGRLDKWRRV